MQPTAPTPTEIFSLKELAERHPRLLPYSRLRWMARNRAHNGLLTSGAAFESPTGEILFSEPKTIEWLLGLAGRAKPRKTRNNRKAA